MKKISIKSFDELIQFIENYNSDPNDIRELISKTIGAKIFFTSQDDKKQLIKDLKIYWENYKDRCIEDRPLFLMTE